MSPGPALSIHSVFLTAALSLKKGIETPPGGPQRLTIGVASRLLPTPMVSENDFPDAPTRALLSPALTALRQRGAAMLRSLTIGRWLVDNWTDFELQLDALLADKNDR